MAWNIRIDPFTRKPSRHDGIDLPFGMNTPMGAFQDGTVTKIENDPTGYGWYVDVKHDDGTTGRYAHAGIINKGVGHRVKRGEELGLVGSTGRSTGPHVHFEHHDQSGKPVDPRIFLAEVGGRPETQFASATNTAPTQTASASAPTQNLGGPNMSSALPLSTGVSADGLKEYVREAQSLIPKVEPSPELVAMMTQNLNRRASNLPLALGAMLSRDQSLQKFGGGLYEDANNAQNPQALGNDGFIDPKTGKFVASPLGESARQQKILELSINAMQRNKSPDPYFTPIMTKDGVASFDNRRGTTQIATDQNGKPIIPFVADAQGQGAVAGAKKGASVTAEAAANELVDAPKAIRSGKYVMKLVDDVINHPGREIATGASRIVPLHMVPGTKAKSFDIALNQIRGAQFLEAFKELKGGGAITQIEGEKATQAISRMDAANDEQEFLKAAKEFQEIVGEAVKRAEGVMARGGKPAGAGAPAPGSTEGLTEEEQRELAELRAWRGGQQ